MQVPPLTALADGIPGPPPQQLIMHVLALVTEIMVDDVALAEKIRRVAMTIWLAERRSWDPLRSDAAARDLQRGEHELRWLLYEALRRGYLSEGRLEELLALLSSLRRQHRPIVATRPRREDEWTDRGNARA